MEWLIMAIVASDIKVYETKSTAAADGESGGNGLGGYRSSDEITTDVEENLFDNVTAAESESGDTEYRAFMVKNTHGTLSFVSAKVYLSVSGSLPISDLTTQLTNGGSETTVDVTNASDFPASGAFFVENEEITYTGKAGNQFTGCTRGVNGTSKVLHIVGTYVEHNQIRICVESPSNKSTGYIRTIADESTEPAGSPTWSAVYTFGTGLSIGTLAPGEFYGVWVRRKIPAGCKAKTGISYEIMKKGETAE
jgi:hypothetical protein